MNLTAEATDMTTGKVALFGTCYGNYNEPGPGEDLMTVFEHNDIPVILARDVQCCGMPKLELGDLAAIQGARDANIPVLASLVDVFPTLLSLVGLDAPEGLHGLDLSQRGQVDASAESSLSPLMVPAF